VLCLAQEPFGEDGAPSAQHWLNAIQQLQLTDEQLHVLSTLHDMHFWTRRLQVRQALDRNIQQQEAHTAAVAAVLQQDEGSAAATTIASDKGGGGGTQAVAAGSSPAACGGSAGTPLAALHGQVRPGGAAQDPLVRFEQLQQSQEALVEERQQLMRRWVLLGLHVAIVTCCTLSTYQQVGCFV
jgi:hypothetical protein